MTVDSGEQPDNVFSINHLIDGLSLGHIEDADMLEMLDDRSGVYAKDAREIYSGIFPDSGLPQYFGHPVAFDLARTDEAKVNIAEVVNGQMRVTLDADHLSRFIKPSPYKDDNVLQKLLSRVYVGTIIARNHLVLPRKEEEPEKGSVPETPIEGITFPTRWTVDIGEARPRVLKGKELVSTTFLWQMAAGISIRAVASSASQRNFLLGHANSYGKMHWDEIKKEAHDFKFPVLREFSDRRKQPLIDEITPQEFGLMDPLDSVSMVRHARFLMRIANR